MQYFPTNLVSVQYVFNTLENFKGQPDEVLLVVRQEAIQKLGELAIDIGNDIQKVADRYQLQINRAKILTSVAAITGALTSIVSNALPSTPKAQDSENADPEKANKAQAKIQLVNSVGTILTLISGTLAVVSSQNSIKAQTELQTLQLKLQNVLNGIKSIQDIQDKANSSTLSPSTVGIGLVVLVLLFK